MGSIRKLLVLRDERGVSDMEIERVMGLREGVVGGLGGRGVVGVCGGEEGEGSGGGGR